MTKPHGPGKAHRQGISVFELQTMFPDEASARAWFEAKRWPDGVRCARCDSKLVQAVKNAKPMPWRCLDCRKYFSVRMCTFMAESRLPLRIWLFAIYLFATSLKGVSSMKLHRDLGITQKTAWFLAHRIREAMEANYGPMTGPVEADETYVGGKGKNMHASKKQQLKSGTSDKAPVIGIKDRTTGQVIAQAPDHVDVETASNFVYEHAQPGAKVFTDSSHFYQDLEWLGYQHQAVIHSAGQYVNGPVHTQGIESFWSMLKRAYVGTFHSMSPKHLQRYVNEFAERASLRDLDTIDIMTAIFVGGIGKRLTYKHLIK